MANFSITTEITLDSSKNLKFNKLGSKVTYYLYKTNIKQDIERTQISKLVSLARA